MASIAELVGKTLRSVARRSEFYGDEIDFVTNEGERYRMFHDQDCSEAVDIEDITGDLADLVGAPILKAEEVTNGDGVAKHKFDSSFTWTFYHLATARGYVTIRWYGTSNGYYSEGVSFERLEA